MTSAVAPWYKYEAHSSRLARSHLRLLLKGDRDSVKVDKALSETNVFQLFHNGAGSNGIIEGRGELSDAPAMTSD